MRADVVGRAFLMLGWLGFPIAQAQAQVAVELTFDSLLIAPIQAEVPELEGEATRLQGVLEQVFESQHSLVPLSDVPDFETLQYDARTYIETCPSGQYSGCALLIGQRGEVDWVIGGTLEPVDQSLGPVDGAAVLNLTMIDIRGSREVMAFGVVVGGGVDDTEVFSGVARVYDQVIDGAFEEVDVRGDLDDPRIQAELDARRKELISASLATLEEQLGAIVRETDVIRVEDPRLTRQDLAEYDQREDASPWDRLDMSRASYIRFQNSGATLLEWRRRQRGRMGQVLLRVGFGGGAGPWGLHHEGRWVKSTSTSGGFENSALRQYQEIRRASQSHVELEAGLGLLPFAEVAFVYAMRSSPFTYRYDQDVDGEPSIVDNVSRIPGGSNLVGGRLVLAPMVTYQVRPTMMMGYFLWNGSALLPAADNDFLQVFDAPRGSFLQVGPGVEVSAGRFLNLFLRGHAEINMSVENQLQIYETGLIATVENFDEPQGSPLGGYTVQAGFQVRIPLLKDPDDGMGPAALEDEPDL